MLKVMKTPDRSIAFIDPQEAISKNRWTFEQYAAALIKERGQRLTEIALHEAAIAGMERNLTWLREDGFLSDAAYRSMVPDDMRYAGSSIRWAILDILSRASVPLNVEYITDQLAVGGYPLRGTSTARMMAVRTNLHRMKDQYGEATQSGTSKSWIITDNGRESLKSIDPIQKRAKK